jgi:hypothetical protein
LALLGQLQFSEISSAQVIFDSPIAMSQANLDFRLRLDPVHTGYRARAVL